MIESPEDALQVRSLFRQALYVRLAVAALVHVTAADSLLGPDHETYDFFAAWLARYWSGDTLAFPWKLREPGPQGYYYIVAALYYVFGNTPILPKLLNCLVGSASVALVYGLALRVSGSSAVALRATRYAAYFPSLVLWSVLNIRDCWVIFLILLICREAMVLQEGVRFRSLALLVAAIGAVMQFREYIFFAVTGPAVVSFLVRNRTHVLRNALIGMVLAGAAIYADRVVRSDRRPQTLDLETLQTIRQGTAVGGSQFEPQADISSPGKALAFLPRGLAFFLFAPFPWTISNLRQVLTLPEMLFLYWLVPFMIGGILFLVRRRLESTLMILLITGGLTLGYALGEANAGMAYRHRAQVLSFYLIFAAVGVEERAKRKFAIAIAGQG